MNYYVIKYHSLYLNKYPSLNYTREVQYATQFAHPDNAKQVISELKLDNNHGVYQINFVEQEIK